MKTILRRFAVAIALGWLVWHVLAILLHQGPANPLKSAAGGAVKRYVHPALIDQRFSMFAPEPSTSSLKFLYRYEVEGGAWSSWRDAGAGLLADHQANRFSPKGHLLWMHQGVARNLVRQMAEIDAALPAALRGPPRTRELHRRLMETPDYALARRYVSDLARDEARRSGGGPVCRVEFLYAAVACVPFSQRSQPDAAQRVEYVKFPAASVFPGP